MSVDRRASAHAIISNFDSIFNPVPSTTPTVHGICAQLKDNISAVLERIHIMPPHPSGCKKETIFPKTKVLEILTLESVRRVLDCICNHCRCAAQSDIRNPDLPAVIHKDYRIILAILIYARRAYMITTFVLGGYTDKWVLEHPLDDDELLALQEGASQRLRLRLDTDFPRLFCDTQYQFLLPRLGKYVDPDADVQTFHYSTLLPFRFKGSMGSGAYGDVFKAELLEGYHGFDEGDVKDGCVAVKLFRDQSTKSSDADAEEGDSPGYEEAMAEKKNNDLVKHSHIVPMLTMFNHRGYRMAIYPLGRASFDNVLKTSELTRYIGTIEHVADQMGNLFSALDTMHRGIPDTCGFHLDIKPANILLLLDNSFALIDLGSAHFKPDMQKTNPAFSATKRRDFSLEYSGPESLVHRTFDVWSMGAVFCELLVLIDEGPTGVAAFRQSRKAKRGIQTVYDFHAENRVKPVVLEKLQDLAKKHRKNRVFVGSVDVVRLLLSPDQAERPSSWEAEVLLKTLVGNEKGAASVRPEPKPKPEVKKLLTKLKPSTRHRFW